MTGIQSDEALASAEEILLDLEAKRCPLSQSIRKSMRLAQLVDDQRTLAWLTLESRGAAPGSTTFRKRFPGKIGEDALVHYIKIHTYDVSSELDQALSQRGVPSIKDKVSANSIESIETDSSLYLEGGDPVFTELLKSQKQRILSSVSNDVHEFVFEVSCKLAYASLPSSLFGLSQKRVDTWLEDEFPTVAQDLKTACERITTNDTEAYSQALLTCRRVLKTLADTFEPASKELHVGTDGEEHELRDHHVINRLVATAEKASLEKEEREYVKATIADLASRITSVYRRTDEGVHSTVTGPEVQRFLIDLYLMLSDFHTIVRQA